MDKNKAREDKIRAVWCGLYDAFLWEKSPQGHFYWQKVADELKDLLRSAELPKLPEKEFMDFEKSG